MLQKKKSTYYANLDEDLLYFCLSFILYFFCCNTMNNNDVSTLQSLQNQKPLLQITQKLNANLIESISIKTLFQRYIIEFCSKKKKIAT